SASPVTGVKGFGTGLPGAGATYNGDDPPQGVLLHVNYAALFFPDQQKVNQLNNAANGGSFGAFGGKGGGGNGGCGLETPPRRKPALNLAGLAAILMVASLFFALP